MIGGDGDVVNLLRPAVGDIIVLRVEDNQRAAILAGGRKRIQAVIVGAGGEQGQSLDLVRVRGGVDKRVVGPVRGPGQADRPLAGQAVDRGGNVSGRVPGGVI